MPDAAKPAPDAVAEAQAAAAAASAYTEPSKLSRAGTWVWNKIILSIFPKKKTLVRAILFSLLGTLPFLLILLIKLPHIIAPFLLLVGSIVWALGGGEDILKQLRWMKNMSKRGPIFWFASWAERKSVVLMRRFYGSKLDVLPLAPKALGTETRGALKAKIKWIPQLSSTYSTEKYEVAIRPTAKGAEPKPADDESGWVKLGDELEGDELLLKPLHDDTQYDVRVRAVNTKGHSEWRSCSFATKQKPVASEDGERSGGSGPGYTWSQHLKDESVVVIVGPLPPSTRAKQLDVKLTPTAVSVKLDGASLLSGELFASVQPDEIEWELKDAPSGGGSSGGRELHLTLLKGGKPGGPFWPQLVKGHPEVDVSSLKRKEKDLDELMAELNQAEAMKGMGRLEELKKSGGMSM